MRKASSMFLVLLAPAFASGTFAAEAPAAMPLPQVWTGILTVPHDNPKLGMREIKVNIAALSSAKEIETLGQELRLGGQSRLRQAMHRLEQKAWVSIGKAAATSVGLVRVVDLPDGRRRMRVVSDFPARLLDSSDPAGSKEHPFALVEMIVHRDGTAEGRMIAAASISLAQGRILVESAGAPVIGIIDVVAEPPLR